MERPNIIFYGDRSINSHSTPLTRPINVVFLTSIRDTGECDRNGIDVETGHGKEYMKGAIERVVEETRPGGVLRKLINVMGVITDDREKAIERGMRERVWDLILTFLYHWEQIIRLIKKPWKSLF